ILTDNLCHPVVQDILVSRLEVSGVSTQTRDLHTSFNAVDGVAQAADVGDSGGLRTPWGNGACPRENIENVKRTLFGTEGLWDIRNVAVAEELIQGVLLVFV